MKRYQKILALLLTLFLVLGQVDYTGISAGESVTTTSDDISGIKSEKPEFTVKETSDGAGVKITTKKASYADGFYIYMKKSGEDKFVKVAAISKNGKKKRSVTIKNLTVGEYSFRIKAYKKTVSNGKTRTEKSKYSKVKKIIVHGQSIGLTGVNNARELGGYVNEDSYMIKKGLLLRTARLQDATDADLEKLVDTYNLGVIIDLRTPAEVDENPDPEIEGVRNINISILEPEIMQEVREKTAKAKEIAEESGVEDPFIMEKMKLESGIFTDSMYVRFLSSDTGKEGFREVFKELLDLPEGKSFLFHCTQGKDRTGCVAMLILYVLGVDEERILDDFLMTNIFNADLIEKQRAELIEKGAEGEELEAYMAVKDIVHAEYMENGMDWLYENYGSPMTYIKSELGLTDDDIEALRTRFLENYREKV